MREPPRQSEVDRLHTELLRGSKEPPVLRRFLEAHGQDVVTLRALLRRPVPVPLLELVGTRPPWSRDASLAAVVVQNTRTPVPLATRLVAGLFWRDLADVAGNLRLPAPVRLRAEATLMEAVRDLRLGEKITLARLATSRVASLLFSEDDLRILRPCFENPRLRESDVVAAVRRVDARRAFLEALSRSRWVEHYAVRLALVLQPRTPLGVALGQLRSLNRGDLREVREDGRVALLIQHAADRLIERPE